MALSRTAGALFGLALGLIVTIGIFSLVKLFSGNEAELTQTRALPALPDARPTPAATASPPQDNLVTRLIYPISAEDLANSVTAVFAPPPR